MMNIKPFPDTGCIHALTVLLPGFPGLICSNMYVLGKGPVTLIDSAPKFPGSLRTMEMQLRDIGFSWSDVERIIITHGHIDHFGLVGQIRSSAGHDIPCYIHEDDQWRVTSDNLKSGMWSEDSDRFAVIVGMPAKDIERMKRRSHFFKNLCDPIDDIRTMQDGDTFRADDFELLVIHTPGHSTGCCCLYEKNHKILFSGDHIIKHITPNPFHEVNRSRLKDPSYQSLKAYMASLARIEDIDAQYVFPGHGEYIEDLSTLISGYRSHHRERTDAIWEALKDGPRSIYGLIGDIFPGIDEGEVFLAVSEILVHLEVLISEGRAELVENGPPAIYRAL
jgi:glyoxylase-like metal-dependent hydrolase (beta-lactamase superfamily II)